LISAPMNRHVKRVLATLPHALHHNYVFTYKGRPIREKNSLTKPFKRAGEKAVIPYGRKVPEGITFHDIRRTVKTNMLNAGVDKVHRDFILGHSMIGMDAHYMAPSEDDLHRAMDKYTAWLDDHLANVDHSVDQPIKKDSAVQPSP
ncbi:MAG: tyrosine-type recombinase/integrase, partial [Desulfobacteria bacterium]